MVKDYDVVVVGAGPGGLVAAWTAATLGARVVCLEEHPQIGTPRHCSGMIQGSSFAEELFKVIDNRVIVSLYTKHRVFGPSGKFIADVPIGGRGCCMVLREEFDKELARLAVRAGAELRLNTRVAGIWREEGRIKGVFTKGGVDKIPGQVVIAADGLYSLQKGIPRQEGLTPPDRWFKAGLTIELTRVHDIETGVLEFYPLTSWSGSWWGTNYVRDATSCFIEFESLKDFEKFKALDHPIARRFKDAVPIRIMGFTFAMPLGQKIPKTVRDGLLLIGDAAGYICIVSSMVSGKYAAQVAVKAIHDEDTSEARLLEYEERCRPLEVMNPSHSSVSALTAPGLTEEMVEEMLTEMARQNQLNFLDQCPY